MIKSDNVTSLLSDYVLLLEKQVNGYSKEDLLHFVEFLGNAADRNIPSLTLGDDMKTVYFRISGKKDQKVTDENIVPFFGFMKFLRDGVIEENEKKKDA